MKSYLREVEKILEQMHVQPTSENFRPESYIGGGQSKLHYIGLRVPQLKSAMKQGFSFSQLPHKEQVAIWNFIWMQSHCYEVMALALDWFASFTVTDELVQSWPLLKKWSERIDNWAHGDTLCGIYAKILEHSPHNVYPTFTLWNRSKNPWLRRLSMVGLIYYSSQRKKVLAVDQILPLVEAQINYDHHYVQRAVGWTLRESHNVYPRETYKFIESHVQDLSAIAFSAATEKFESNKKEKLKNIRKKAKKKQ